MFKRYITISPTLGTFDKDHEGDKPLDCETASLPDTLGAIHGIFFFYSLEHGLRIHGFRLTWSSLFLQHNWKFLQPSSYYNGEHLHLLVDYAT